jgi:hypothetical protein
MIAVRKGVYFMRHNQYGILLLIIGTILYGEKIDIDPRVAKKSSVLRSIDPKIDPKRDSWIQKIVEINDIITQNNPSACELIQLHRKLAWMVHQLKASLSDIEKELLQKIALDHVSLDIPHHPTEPDEHITLFCSKFF